MTIETNRAELLSALKRCASVAPAKSPQPVIAHVLLSLDGSQLSYCATNLRSTIHGAIDATGKSAAFSVNVRDLIGALDVLSGERVKLKLADTRVAVTGEGKRSFKLRTLPDAEFPRVERHDLSEAPDIDGDALRRLLRQTSFCAAEDSDERDWLRAVRLRTVDGKLTAAATDGKRAALCSIPFDGAIDATVPNAAVRLLLDSKSERIAIGQHGTSALFRFDDATLATLIPSQEMPAVENGFRDIPSLIATIPDPSVLAESISAIKRADTAGDVLVMFRRDSIRIDAKGDNHGVDELDIQCAGEAAVGVAASMLTQALSASEGQVDVFFEAFPNPLYLTCGEQRYVIMPLLPEVLDSKRAKE